MVFERNRFECQRNKHFSMKVQTAPTQSFSQHAPSFDYRISMDTENHTNPLSRKKSNIHVIGNAFCQFVVTAPIKSHNAEAAI